MTAEKIIFLAVLCTVLIVLLKNSRPEQAIILSMMSAILLFFCVIETIQPILTELKSLIQRFSFIEQQSEILLKSLGLCCLTQIAADLCRDAGETALAVNVELAGKTAILVLSLPLFRQLFDFAVVLLQ